MNAMLSRVIGAGLFFLVIFISGFWLSRSGKPYPALLFTLHKLIALGALVFLGILVSRVHQSAPLQPAQIAAIALTAVFFVVTILTGGLGSLEKGMPPVLLRLHQFAPYLTLLSAATALYLLLAEKQLALLTH